MGANPFLGVFFHWLGGLASGSFYVPYQGVRKWSWETYWLVGGFFSWIICPWVLAFFMTSDLIGVLKQQSAGTLWWTYCFGAMWGFGGLTFGLTMRYLGMSLGMGVALGYCAAFGTLVPPIFKAFLPDIPVDSSIVEIARSTAGQVTLAGVVVCLLGIGIAALAGLTKEREMSETAKKKAIAEFNFTKGILVATFSGIMSACFAFGLAAAGPIKIDSLKTGYLNGAAQSGVQVVDPGSLPTISGDQFARKLAVSAPSGSSSNPLKFAELVEGIETNAVFARLVLTQIAGSNHAIALRLAAYTSGYEKMRTNPPVVATLRELKDFSQKEVALAIASAGGDVIALHKRFGLWQGLPALVVVLLGGFTTNFLWCVLLNLKNRTGYQYLAKHVRPEHAGQKTSDGEHGSGAASAPPITAVDLQVPRLRNYFFSALAGTTWYFQFFFYTMGETQMGKFGFASWTLHMASIIIFSTMWGWILHEWKGSSKKAHSLIASGIVMLILSTIIIGVGTWLKTKLTGQ